MTTLNELRAAQASAAGWAQSWEQPRRGDMQRMADVLAGAIALVEETTRSMLIWRGAAEEAEQYVKYKQLWEQTPVEDIRVVFMACVDESVFDAEVAIKIWLDMMAEEHDR